MSLKRQEKINILMAQDINAMKIDMAFEDYGFICSVLAGDGWKQYNNLTDKKLDIEFKDRIEDIKDCVSTLSLAHKLNGKPIDLLKI